jgi:hypothetical protein
MALQFSDTVRNGMLDNIESTISTAPTLEIRSGTVPATCATADAGTLLASMTLPSDWMAAAASGSKAKLGTWEDTSANATGTAGHFRIKQGGTCHMQGTVTATGGGGDLTLDNTSIASGQAVSITTFTLTAPGA